VVLGVGLDLLGLGGLADVMPGLTTVEATAITDVARRCIRLLEPAAEHFGTGSSLRVCPGVASSEDHVWFEDRWMVASFCDE
jgi:hypothetical protein